MNFRMPLVRLAMVAFAASITSPFLVVDVMAAKEKFERTKPHVNVGTIGNVGSSQTTSEIATPPAEPGGDTGAADCAQKPSASSAPSKC